MGEELYDVVYEDQNDGRYYWHCSKCGTTYSSDDYFSVEHTANAHKDTGC